MAFTTQSQLGNRIAQAKKQGFSDQEINSVLQQQSQRGAIQQRAQPSQPQETSGRGGFFSSLIQEGGAIGGAVTGGTIGSALGPLGTLAGAAIGGGIGSLFGSFAEQKVRDDKIDIGKAARSAAIDAALSAGPLRVGKAAFGAGKVATGALFKQAVGKGATQQLSKKAIAEAGRLASTSFTKQAFSKLGRNAAIKSFRFSPSQLTKFKGKFGHDISDTIIKHNIIGKSAENIDDIAIKPLFTQFDEIVKAIPSINARSVTRAFKSTYDDMLKSANPQLRKRGEALREISDDILTRAKDGKFSADDINAFRRSFDDTANFNNLISDPGVHDISLKSANILRGAIRQAADDAGLKTQAGNLRLIGKEISKLKEITDFAAKQANLGRGKLPIGLGATTAGTAGAVLGGPVGGIGTAAAVIGGRAAINSRIGQSLGSRALLALGKEGTSGLLGPGFSVAGQAARIGIPAALTAGAQPPSGDQGFQQIPQGGFGGQLPTGGEAGLAQQPFTTAGAFGGEQAAPQQDLGIFSSQETFAQALQDDFIRTGGENFEFLQQIAQFKNPALLGGEEQKLSSEQQKNLLAINNLEATSATLISLLNAAGGGKGRIGGQITKGLAFAQQNPQARVFQDFRKGFIGQFAKALSGEQRLTDQDIARAEGFIPRLTDTPEEIDIKLENMAIVLEQRKQATMSVPQSFDPFNEFVSNQAADQQFEEFELGL